LEKAQQQAEQEDGVQVVEAWGTRCSGDSSYI